MRALLLTLLLISSPAWAINKCVDKTGKVTYSDKACPSGQSRSMVETRETWTTPGGPAEPDAAPADATASAAPPKSDAGAWLAEQEKAKKRRQTEDDIRRLETENAALRKSTDKGAAGKIASNQRNIDALRQQLAQQ